MRATRDTRGLFTHLDIEGNPSVSVGWSAADITSCISVDSASARPSRARKTLRHPGGGGGGWVY